MAHVLTARRQPPLYLQQNMKHFKGHRPGSHTSDLQRHWSDRPPAARSHLQKTSRLSQVRTKNSKHEQESGQAPFQNPTLTCPSSPHSTVCLSIPSPLLAWLVILSQSWVLWGLHTTTGVRAALDRGTAGGQTWPQKLVTEEVGRGPCWPAEGLKEPTAPRLKSCRI